MNIEERLERNKSIVGECHEWTGSTINKYGVISIKNRTKKVHRVSYELRYGPIPAGKVVCHSCDNTRCFNPEHLWLGTVAQNNSDMKAKARQASGTRNPGCKLSPESVLEIRSSTETCLSLSQIYGVNTRTISKIRTRKLWSNLEEMKDVQA